MSKKRKAMSDELGKENSEQGKDLTQRRKGAKNRKNLAALRLERSGREKIKQ